MESGLRVTRKGRKLGSSRRRQMREPADGQDVPVAPEPESWSSQSAEELQSFFQDCGAEERGFVTREDLAAAKFSFLSSEDELEMIFDWVDVERKGRLSLEEFSSGLKNIFGSSSSSHRLHRKRPLLSKRGSVATSFPVVEEANSEEKEAFFAFMEQLGASNSLPEQAEIWQLWRTLRQEEPQLAGNLEGFLAKMNSRLQEARADKEVLELTLRKRDTDHHREVQQLYEEMEQQIQREKQQLQAESDSRGLALSSQMQEVLEAKEREVQRLTEGQKELEAQLHRLSSTHQEASSENRQLREAERDLAGRLEEVRGQLQVTRGQLDAARGRVSWQMEEELSVPRAGEEKAPDAQAVSCEEAPLPGLFGDNDDWDQLLSGIGSTPLSALQLCWSPPPTPKASPGPPTPRVVRQISILEPHAPLFAQEPSSDPGGSPRSPPGAPSGTEEEEGANPDGPDTSPPEQIGQPPSLEPREESQLGPGVHIPWGLPGVPAGESGSLVAGALKVLVPLEDGPPPQVTSPPPQASAGPKAWFQTSHLETHVPLFAQEASSDPGGSPRSPPGAPSGTEEEEGANPDGPDTSPPEQIGQPPSPEPREESQLGPGVHIPWGLPGVPAGESGSLVAGALKVLVPLEDGPPLQVTSPPPQASAGPKAWFQTSHLETHVPLFAQEPSSDPGGSPRSPPGALSGTEEEEGANPDGPDTSPPEQIGQPPSPEPREESQLGPGVHIPWGLPGVPAGESGSLVAAALEVLAPLEDGAPPEVTSPPPQASAGPKAWFQTSHLETHVPLFAQEPSSDPGGCPRSPPGAPSGTEEEEGVNPDGMDTSPPEQTGEPPSPEPREESGLGPGVHFPWGLPGVPAGESGSLVAGAVEVLVPLEDGPPLQVTSPTPQTSAGPSAQFQTSHPDDESPDPGPIPPKPPRQREALVSDPHSAGSEPRPGSSGAGALSVGLGEPSQDLVPGGPAPMDGWEQGKPNPDAQEGHSGELQEAHSRVPGLPAFLPWSLEEEPGAEERKAGNQGDQQFRSELTIEVRGLKPEHSELPQLDSQPAPGPPDRMQAEAEAEAPAPRKPSRGFARMGPQPGDGAGPPEPTQTLPTRAELEAQPRPRPTTTHAEGEQAPSKSREPRAENRPEDPRTDSGGPGLTPPPGDHAASEPLANPDYAFHVIFLGDANVGKTSFLHLLHQNSFATGLTATVGVDFRVKNLLVDNKRFALQLWDTAGQERYHSVTRQLLRKADGVVLMYDVTSQESFVHVRYWLDCLQDAESDDVVILLLGNKTDCEEDRQVSTEAGQQLAQELGVSFGECSAALGHNILEPMVHLARSLKMQEERLKGSLVEVAPEKPPKRAGCCS
ncbi:ras-related protein Rab-44 isoform 1-T2 [Dama dama]